MRARFHRPPLAKEGRTRRRTAGAARLVQRRKGKGSACRDPERVNLEDKTCLSPPGQSPVVRGRGRPERTRYALTLPSARVLQTLGQSSCKACRVTNAKNSKNARRKWPWLPSLTLLNFPILFSTGSCCLLYTSPSPRDA